MNWEIVIGLEIHAELNTESKLFSRAPNRFGDEPNTNISEVCTGQPGALPVLNKEAVKKAVQLGCALDAQVNLWSKFDRKSYFYPDSPRNFQITQFDEPIITGGRLVTEIDGEEQSFEVDRVHLEDDAGTLKHFGGFAGVDYNRAGVPLVEIVSKPCMHSAKEAVAYAMTMRAILQYIDASDCNMEEGSLRFDVNISIRKEGETTLRNKTELKNLNSFTAMQLAIEAEVKRQIKAYEKEPDKDPSEVIGQATFRWDPETMTTVLMREKESADDYRYFPEPDLPPLVLTEEFVKEIRSQLPELPLQRERRYIQTLELAHESAFILVSDKKLSDYFEEALKHCSNARNLCNWIIVEFAGRLKEMGQTLADTDIPPEQVGTLVRLIEESKVTGKIAKSVADEMLLYPQKGPETIISENPDFQPLSDEGAVEDLVNQVIMEQPQSVEDFQNGKDRAFGFLVGQVMKLCKGKADPQIVNKILRKKIAK